MQKSVILRKGKGKVLRITFRRKMRKKKGVSSLISPPLSSKLNNGGGREKRKRFNREFNVMYVGVIEYLM